MYKYHKIHSIFKRDKKGRFTPEYSRPEFEYLKDAEWVGTEKVDGTNIRIGWKAGEAKTLFGGRTDRAQIPAHLIERLVDLFPAEKMADVFGRQSGVEEFDITLFGEGYGHKIQKVGSQYLADSVDFILFDVRVGTWWLNREDVDAIADDLGIQSVPVVVGGTLDELIEIVKSGMDSELGDLRSEGLVLRPAVELQDRAGNRIITKVKTRDFV